MRGYVLWYARVHVCGLARVLCIDCHRRPIIAGLVSMRTWQCVMMWFEIDCSIEYGLPCFAMATFNLRSCQYWPTCNFCVHVCATRRALCSVDACKKTNSRMKMHMLLIAFVLPARAVYPRRNMTVSTLPATSYGHLSAMPCIFSPDIGFFVTCTQT